LTIKSTSHIRPEANYLLPANTPVDATSSRFTNKTCVLYARQYSVVKDLDCLGNQQKSHTLQTAEF